MKVLVTGGAGFIGSHIVEELLLNNYEVAVLDNFSSGKLSNIEANKVTIYEGDVVDENFVNKVVSDFKPMHIIHQAAQVSVAESVNNMLKDEQINIKGSLNIINAARVNNVNRIVFASSAAVYGNPQYLPVDENHPVNPMSPYGLSKLTVEKYLEISNSLYGLNYTILRYSNVYGPRQDAKGEGGVVSIFTDNVCNEKNLHIFGDGMQTRDFIFVKDVARANVASLKLEENFILNVSSNTIITIKELAKLVISENNSTVIIEHGDERLGDIKDSLLDNKLLIEHLNVQQFTDISEGLKLTTSKSTSLV